MYSSIVLVLALVSSSMAIVDFRNCAGSLNPPQVVSVEGCSGMTCQLTAGSEVGVRVEFVSPISADSVEAVSTIGADSKSVLVCSNGLDCPVYPGEYYIFNGKLTVGKSSSGAKSLTYLLKSANQALVCFTLPISVE